MTSTSGPDLRGVFHLDDSPSLSRSTVDRREQLRTADDHVRALWPDARVVLVDPQGRSPVVDDGGGVLRLATAASSRVGEVVPDGAVMLGAEAGVAYWGVRVADPDHRGEHADRRSTPTGNDARSGEHADRGFTADPGRFVGPDSGAWSDLRTSGAALDARGAGLLTTAVSLLNWHDRSGFCARDGSPTHAIKCGWARVCEAARHEEYPRTDPSMICLVHDGGDRVLLARQPIWPAGRYSVLAGFVEAGESLEACVARECAEEVGVTVGSISYLGSQPWPFPRSIMIGFAAVADPDQPLRLQEGEIESARWVTRGELIEALAAGEWSALDGGARGVGGTAFEPGTGRALMLPGGVSIARAMLEAWAAAG